MAKTAPLPEVIDQSKATVQAKVWVEAKNAFETAKGTEEIVKSSLTNAVETVRRIEADAKNYVGIVRVTADGQPPVRVQWKLDGSNLAIEDRPSLDKMLTTASNILFKNDKYVSNVTDVNALVRDLIAKGVDLATVFKMEIKDHAPLIGCSGVEVDECLTPSKTFLNDLQDNRDVITEEGHTWLKEYLEARLVPAVYGPPKGKGDAS
jgi:CRISPR/Cas system-associated exonuclease Cas4 (RecB family)